MRPASSPSMTWPASPRNICCRIFSISTSRERWSTNCPHSVKSTIGSARPLSGRKYCFIEKCCFIEISSNPFANTKSYRDQQIKTARMPCSGGSRFFKLYEVAMTCSPGFIPNWMLVNRKFPLFAAPEIVCMHWVSCFPTLSVAG